MDNIEKLLSQMPKGKLSKKTGLILRFRLGYLLWLKNIKNQNLSIANIFSSYRYATVISLTLLFVAVLVIPGFAYANDKILPGNWLYPVKRAVEAVEMGLPQSEEKKIEVLEKIATRRLNEAEVLSAVSPEIQADDIVKTVNEAVNLSAKADIIAAKLEATTSQNVMISQRQEMKIQKLSRVAENIGIGSSEKLEDTVAIAFEKIQRGRGSSTRTQIRRQFEFPAAAIRGASSTEEEAGSTEATSTGSMIRNNKNLWDPINSDDKKRNKATSTKLKQAENSATQNLSAVQDKIDNLETELDQDEVDQDDYKKLFDRLHEKMQKAESAFQQGNMKQFQGLIQSTEALTNNAKHFIKQKSKIKHNEQSGSEIRTATTSPNTKATSTDIKINKKSKPNSKNRKKQSQDQ